MGEGRGPAEAALQQPALRGGRPRRMVTGRAADGGREAISEREQRLRGGEGRDRGARGWLDGRTATDRGERRETISPPAGPRWSP